MNRKHRLTAAAFALGIMFAGVAHAAPYILTTDPPTKTSPAWAVLDTVFTTTAGAADTLNFGFVADWASVYTDEGDTVDVKYFATGIGSNQLLQLGGTAPPAAAAARARYGALRFSWTSYTIMPSSDYPTGPYLLPIWRGVIFGSRGAAHAIRVRAVRVK